MKYSFGVSLGLLVIISIGTKCNGERNREVTPGCEPGWDSFQDKCYFTYQFPLYTYEEARILCIALGGTLAKINDVNEDLYLKGYTEGKFHMWLGANDLENEGSWKWEDRTSVTYSNWYTNQPDNGANLEHCLHLHKDWQGKWNDGQCGNPKGFICEKDKCLIANSVCRVVPVGLESGDVPDSQITASSSWRYDHMSYQGRLNYVGTGSQSWCAAENTIGQWLQVNMGYERRVTKVATQGRGDSEQWVKTYHLKFFNDGQWKYVSDGMTRIFQGNSDRNTIMYHDLVENSFTSQYVRFYPLTWEGHMSMRVEVYVCQ